MGSFWRREGITFDAGVAVTQWVVSRLQGSQQPRITKLTNRRACYLTQSVDYMSSLAELCSSEVLTVQNVGKGDLLPTVR
jgi:hypothetical protein